MGGRDCSKRGNQEEKGGGQEVKPWNPEDLKEKRRKMVLHDGDKDSKMSDLMKGT